MSDASDLRPLGVYRDRLYDAEGRVVLDTGWRKNIVVVDCMRLIAGFMVGSQDTALGIQGLQIGAGDPTWDGTSGSVAPPPPSSSDTALVDRNPYTVPGSSLAFSYIDASGATAPGPTNRLQVVATIGSTEPPWPDANHTDTAMREFALIGTLGGVGTVLIDEVRHPVVRKGTNVLVRTIQLTF